VFRHTQIGVDRLANTLQSAQSPSIRLWGDALNAHEEHLLVAARNGPDPMDKGCRSATIVA